MRIFLLLSIAFASLPAMAQPALSSDTRGVVTSVSCSDGGPLNEAELPSELRPGAAISGGLILVRAGAHAFSVTQGGVLNTSWPSSRLYGRKPCRNEYLFVKVALAGRSAL